MRLLFIHEVNYRDKVVFEMHDFPELLALAGHDVTFIDFGEGGERTGLRRWFDWRSNTELVRNRAHDGAEVRVIQLLVGQTRFDGVTGGGNGAVNSGLRCGVQRCDHLTRGGVGCGQFVALRVVIIAAVDVMRSGRLCAHQACFPCQFTCATRFSAEVKVSW